MFENNILLAFGTVSVTTNIQQYSSKVYLGTLCSKLRNEMYFIQTFLVVKQLYSLINACHKYLYQFTDKFRGSYYTGS